MCGIIGYSGSENAVPKILEGLSALEYRGYDSAGIAVFDSENTIKVVKSKGKLALLEEKIAHLESKLVSSCGIGPVSYTHLDVYKRQLCEKSCLRPGFESKPLSENLPEKFFDFFLSLFLSYAPIKILSTVRTTLSNFTAAA